MELQYQQGKGVGDGKQEQRDRGDHQGRLKGFPDTRAENGSTPLADSRLLPGQRPDPVEEIALRTRHESRVGQIFSS